MPRARVKVKGGGEEMETEKENRRESKARRSAAQDNEKGEEESEPMDVDGDDGEGGAEAELEDIPDLVRLEDGGFRVGKHYIPPPPPPALTFDNDRPRLVITHIENENFKSYQGVQTLGPFHKSFSSIVGPNGSGKSNVIDSMLFVFGYRAAKIRSKKISVLIHNSEQHANISSCTVKVHFQEIVDKKSDEIVEGEPDFEVVPESQFYVARTANKDNSSHYEIDGKRKQFKEVSKLLRDKGVDLDHNRFLILQGEVEQIALMKPKAQGEHDTGMLEFLEDIIGSSRFQNPIEILKSSVATLDEQRAEKLNRVKLVEKEKDELEGPKNAALEYLRLENKIVEKKNLGYQQYLFKCELAIEDIEKNKAKWEEGAKDVIAKVNRITEEKNKKEAELVAAKKALTQIQTDMEEAQESFKKTDLEDQRLREDMRNMNVKRKKLQHLSKQEKEKYEKLLNVPEVNKEKIEECVQLKDKLNTQIKDEEEKYSKAVETLKGETQVYQDKKEELETQLMGMKNDLGEKDEAVKVIQTKLDVAKSKEEKERLRLEQYQLQAQQTVTKLTEDKDKLKEVTSDGPQLEKELAELQGKVDGLQANEKKCLDVVRRLRSNFEEKRSHMTAHKSQGKVHDALMRARDRGELPGIFGRLGDLGAIDPKYDVAISTAGTSLDNILVDTATTGNACIRYLKEHNIGRTNFIALDKQEKHRRNMAAKGFPAPRLFDLIRPQDEKFLPAFYYAVRDTLVAKDKDEAERLAFNGRQRHRVVTLGGDMFETAGSISGGGRQVSRGKMGAQLAADEVDPRELKRMEQDVNSAEEKHRAAVKDKTDCEDRMVVINRLLREKGNEREALAANMRKSEEKVKNLKQAIKEQEKKVAESKTDEKVLADLKKEEEKLQAVFDKAKEKVDDVNHQVKQLNAKIKEITGSKLKTISKTLDERKTQLEKVKKEITNLEVGIKSAERDVKKSKDKIDNYDSEVSDVEDKMRKEKEKRVELEKLAKEWLDKVKELKTNEGERTKQNEDMQERLEEFMAKEKKYRAKEIELNQERDKYEEEINEQNRNIGHWKRELRKLKLRDVPGEEVPEELEKHSQESLEAVDMKQWQYDLNLMEEKLGTMKINYAVIEEYTRKEAVYLERVAELEQISQKRDKQRQYHDDLKKMRLMEFMKGFSIITQKLKEMYQMITLGGDAELELVDSLDPFTEGVVFSVRPPKKSWKHISNLSGGEKTLSSLALVFALHYYKPTPLYVMDEIDAALDFKNVSIVANYIKERTKNAQFIIISLRSNMFELADRLVGIYKTYNCTKSVTINPPALAANSASASATAAGQQNANAAANKAQQEQEGGQQQQEQQVV